MCPAGAEGAPQLLCCALATSRGDESGWWYPGCDPGVDRSEDGSRWPSGREPGRARGWVLVRDHGSNFSRRLLIIWVSRGVRAGGGPLCRSLLRDSVTIRYLVFTNGVITQLLTVCSGGFVGELLEKLVGGGDGKEGLDENGYAPSHPPSPHASPAAAGMTHTDSECTTAPEYRRGPGAEVCSVW